jgi:exoribonuclease II
MIATPHILFEEDGAFKVGTIMSDAGASMQVEHASGRRVKIKSSQVMLRFDKPEPTELMAAAQRVAQEIDLDFLWQCAPQDEFNFVDLAQDYFGGKVSADQSTALLQVACSPGVLSPQRAWPLSAGAGRYS